MIYALDTNIVIRYLKNDHIVKQNFDEACLQGHDFILPKVVDYEMRRGFRITSAPKKLVAYSIMTEEIAIAEIDTFVWGES